MIGGFFRQHWAGGTFLGEVMNFNTNSNIQFDSNLFGYSTSQSQLTFSVWLYPTASTYSYIFYVDNRAVMSINGGKIYFDINGTGVNHSTATITTNQWNHVLVSMRRSNTTLLSFGSDSGATFDFATKRSYNTGTGYQNDFHLVVNGTRYSRYIQPNTSPSIEDGFFQNDFATGTTGASATFGEYFDNNYGGTNQLFTSDNTTDTFLGSDNSPANYYNGDMFQFWLKNTFYDLTQSSNVALFRNSNNTSVSALPSAPVAYIVGGQYFNVGSTSSTYTLNNITTSSRSKP